MLPSGFKRIRHYALLAPAAKTDRLALARELLAMPSAITRAAEDARDFMRRVAAINIASCSHCRVGRWLTVEQVALQRPTSGPCGRCRSAAAVAVRAPPAASRVEHPRLQPPRVLVARIGRTAIVAEAAKPPPPVLPNLLPPIALRPR